MRRQRVVTRLSGVHLAPTWFPINRCHQRVVTPIRGNMYIAGEAFPINRCHQRVVTQPAHSMIKVVTQSFQSIGVTSEW